MHSRRAAPTQDRRAPQNRSAAAPRRIQPTHAARTVKHGRVTRTAAPYRHAGGLRQRFRATDAIGGDCEQGQAGAAAYAASWLPTMQRRLAA